MDNSLYVKSFRNCIRANCVNRLSHRIRWNMLLILLSIFWCGSFLSHNALAVESFEAATERLKAIQIQIRELRFKLRETEGKAGELQSKLAATEVEFGQVTTTLHATNQQLVKMESRLRTLKSERKTTLKTLSKQKSSLKHQLRAAYAIGRQEKLKLLLNQQDPSSISRTLTYYNYLTKSRTRKIASFNETLFELGRLERDITQETDMLHQLGDQLKNQKRHLEKSRKQRNEVLNALRDEIKQQNTSLETFKKDELRLQRLIKSLQMALADIPNSALGYRSFAKSKSKLGWPVEGQIRNLFGKSRVDSANNLKWQGVIIESKHGQEVRAISTGRIAFSDWLPRYGLLIIIDHGQGYMSLYGHNQSLHKSVGDWVKTGDLIAKSGDSGGQETSGLYFEIRHNGKPLNPSAWCSSAIQVSQALQE